MKVNLWRIIIIIATCILAFTIWYLFELNETAKEHISLLEKEKKFMAKQIVDSYVLKKTLQAEISESRKEKEILLARIDDYENNTEKLILEMEKLKKGLSGAEKLLYSKNMEMEELKRKTKGYNRSSAYLRNRLDLASGEEVYEETADSDIPLEPIMVKSKSKKIKGKVLDVNHYYNFVVINVGRRHGVRKGDTLFVRKGRIIIGKIVIEKVVDDVSIARPIYKTLGGVIKKGNRVMY